MGVGKSRSSAVSRSNRGNLGKGSDDGASVTAKIGLIATLLAALIAGAATVLAAVIGNGPDRAPLNSPPDRGGALPAVVGVPEPTCPTCAPGPGGQTFTQQVHTSNPAGTTTFKDPRGFGGQGPRVLPGQQVEVVCRFHDPNAPPTVQPGWWYLIHSPPWNREYYTPANSYLNTDPLKEPRVVADVDERVPVC